jgi:hypothetical protein
MSNTIPYVADLRATAATIVAYRISADCHSTDADAAIEEALESATLLLIDAFLIEQAISLIETEPSPTAHVTIDSAHRAWKQADGNRYRYLRQLQCWGELPLRTLEIADNDGQT